MRALNLETEGLGRERAADPYQMFSRSDLFIIACTHFLVKHFQLHLPLFLECLPGLSQAKGFQLFQLSRWLLSVDESC